MARLPEKLIGPASSTGSPITFMMRPSVPSPTGTAIAWPVSTTSLPRTRPSVESIATVRTVDSPRCCATSRISRLPLLSVSSALRISGNGPSNCTSTTAPMTWATRPILLLVAFTGAFIVQPFASKRFRARDDLDQFLGDHGLAGAVVLQGEPVDDFAGVAGCRIHRTHSRALFRSRVFQKRAEDLHRDVARQQSGENFGFIGLILVDGSCRLLCRAGCRFDRRGNQPLCDRFLRNHGFEFGVADRRRIERAFLIKLEHAPADRSSVAEADALHVAHLDGVDYVSAVKASQ